MRFIILLLMIIAGVRGFAQPSWQPASFEQFPMLETSVLGATTYTQAPYAQNQLQPELELRRFKKQAIQSVSLTGGGLFDAGNDRLSSQFLEASIGSGIPLGRFDNILGVKPGFRVDWIDAAPKFDIPDKLYQFELQFFYRRSFGERLSAIAVISPSIRSDLTTSDNALRVFALGLLNWECIAERLTLSGGAVFLGRADLPVLPAIGLSWTPNRLTRLDLRFPTTKLSRRLSKIGRQSDTWAYSSLGLGGNTWSITRQTLATDQVSLRDFRLMLGIERLVDGGGGAFAEAGYSFARRLEYESDGVEIPLNDAIALRLGWRY